MRADDLALVGRILAAWTLAVAVAAATELPTLGTLARAL